MKKVFALALALIMLLSFVACAAPAAEEAPAAEAPAAEAPAAEEAPAEGEKAFTAVIADDSFGAPFSQLVWSGFLRLQEEFGTDIKFVEALDAAAYEQQLRAIAEQGANPVFVMFDGLSQVAMDISAEYPDTFFVLLECNIPCDLPNVCHVAADAYDSNFIAGVMSAMRTEVGKLAWIGCYDSDVVNRYRDGYHAGINWANEKFGTSVTLDVSHIGDAVDTVKGAEAAKIMIDNGADIVAQAANMAGIGVINACQDAGVLCVGCDSWQGDKAECVFWTAIVAIDKAIYATYCDFLEDKLEPGVHTYAIHNGGAAYDERDYERATDEEKAIIDGIMADVKAGVLDIYSLNPYA